MLIFIIFILILINGLFVMAEISIISSRKSKLEVLNQKGNKSAKEVLKHTENPSKFLSTVQIGITLISILTGVVTGDILTEPLKILLEKIALFQPFASEMAMTLILIPVTYFSLVLGELIPKRIGLSNPENIAIIFIKPINWLSNISSPFIWILQKSTDIFVNILNIKQSTNAEVIEEEIKSLVEEGMAKGTIEEIEQDIVENVFQVGDRKISSLMTHNSEIEWIETNFTIEKLQNLLKHSSHSFYPVRDSQTDELIGVVRSKLILLHYFTESEFNLMKYVFEPIMIPESTSAYKVLEKFRSTRSRFGIIIDEYGSITGIVTLNDILDAIIGDLDTVEGLAEIKQREDGSWLIDAQISFADFCKYFDINIALVENKGFNTLGGLILDIMQQIPHEGEKISWREFDIEIIDMDGARIDKLLISKKEGE